MTYSKSKISANMAKTSGKTASHRCVVSIFYHYGALLSTHNNYLYGYKVFLGSQVTFFRNLYPFRSLFATYHSVQFFKGVGQAPQVVYKPHFNSLFSGHKASKLVWNTVVAHHQLKVSSGHYS